MAFTHHFEALRAIDVVYRDEVLIAINKPARLSTASSDGADDLVTRVKRMLAAERDGDARHVYVGALEHLERDASGVVLLTLDKRANRGLAQQFEQSTIERVFDVVTIADNAPRRIANTTRRSVQLRAELAKQGTPVVGDVMQGAPPFHRAMCHARSLALRHPTTNSALTIECAPPASLRRPLSGAFDPAKERELWLALLREAASERFSITQHAQATTAYRLVHGATDGMPGLVIDRYDAWFVIHIFDDAWTQHIDALSSELRNVTGATGVYVKQHPKQKNDLDENEIATLAAESPVVGEAAPDPLMVTEHGVPLHVRLGDGLRTGLFLDQRDNRHRVRSTATDQRVLNLFAYTCGFSIAALAGKAAHVTSVDASALVMSRVEPSLQMLDAKARHRSLVGDCFEVLRTLREHGERFDLVIVDPPSYASTSAGRFRLRRDYAALVELCCGVTGAGGALLCCTNHHTTTDRDLRGFVQQGAERARRRIARARSLAASVDFPAMSGQAAELKSLWVELE